MKLTILKTTLLVCALGGWALAQLWLFWLAPIVGGAIGGLLYGRLASEDEAIQSSAAR